jgi:hypothetical protein
MMSYLKPLKIFALRLMTGLLGRKPKLAMSPKGLARKLASQ